MLRKVRRRVALAVLRRGKKKASPWRKTAGHYRADARLTSRLWEKEILRENGDVNFFKSMANEATKQGNIAKEYEEKANSIFRKHRKVARWIAGKKNLKK